MKKLAYICFSAAILAVFVSCNSFVKEGSFDPVRAADPNYPGTQIRWNNVAVLDRSIQQKIFVQATNSRRTPTGTLEVWTILRNRTDYPLQVEARAAFYDESQAPLEGPTAWQRLYLTPNATAHYQTASTLVNIGYYTIEVREGL
jgi:hypothetical protein